MMRYIIVTGGVISGLGKGITASSIGLLLKQCGWSVTPIKIDPYLNQDAGTMSPYQHGEVYVLDDGSEVDLDLGNYERFLNTSLLADHNITTGKVYTRVLNKERRGDYLGKTVQIIPHITEEIREWVVDLGTLNDSDIVLIELGGTIGDIESMPFVEGLRQLRRKAGPENVMFVHTTLVPTIGSPGELKTKPTQHSVKELRSLGIQPDILVCRSKKALEMDIKEKLSLFTDVPVEGIFSAYDAENIYQVPLIFLDQNVHTYVQDRLGLERREPDLDMWRTFVDGIMNPKGTLSIGFVGKYTELRDSYLSHIKSFEHAGSQLGVKVDMVWLDADVMEERIEAGEREIGDFFDGVDGILIPGGFGERGVLGKMMSQIHALDHGIPTLGICLGFQTGVIAFARHVLGWEGAHSTEFEEDTPYPVIDFLPETKTQENMGGTMRLGLQDVVLSPDSDLFKYYKKENIRERHRHRYEVNPDHIQAFEEKGMHFVGKDTEGIRMEIYELEGHPFFVGTQFHPEFLSRPGHAVPTYMALLEAAIEYRKKRLGQ